MMVLTAPLYLFAKNCGMVKILFLRYMGMMNMATMINVAAATLKRLPVAGERVVEHANATTTEAATVTMLQRPACSLLTVSHRTVTTMVMTRQTIGQLARGGEGRSILRTSRKSSATKRLRRRGNGGRRMRGKFSALLARRNGNAGVERSGSGPAVAHGGWQREEMPVQ